MKYIIWCEDPYILAALIGNIKIQNKNKFVIYTSKLAFQILNLIEINDEKIKIINIGKLRITKMQLFIHKALFWFLETPNLSYLWKLEREKKFKYPKDISFSILVEHFLNPKLSRKIYRFLTGCVPGYYMKHDEIYIYSICNYPFLFSKYKCKVNFIFDSWDHIFKSPLLLSTERIFTWNESISKIILEKHCTNNIISTNTFRFDYINRYLKNKKSANKKINNKFILKKENKFNVERWIYFFSYSLFDSKERFYFELDLINHISLILSKRDIKTFIKLKPFHLKEEEICISKYKFLNEIKGNDSIKDYLSENKLHNKCCILDSSNLLISISSTILLEGALLDVPILPLFNKDSKNLVLSNMSKNDHLNKFLSPIIKENYLLKMKRDPLQFFRENNISEIKKACKELSNNLKSWYYQNNNEKLPYF